VQLSCDDHMILDGLCILEAEGVLSDEGSGSWLWTNGMGTLRDSRA